MTPQTPTTPAALPEEVERFNLVFRIQHAVMAGSFLLLFFTGWALKFHEVQGSHALIDWWGGPRAAGLLHRAAGITMLVDSIFHVGYLAFRALRGKLRWDIIPDWQDCKDACQNVRYFLGLAEDKPRFRKFNYLQKFDYWAVFWGVFVIGTSGLALTFPTRAAVLFPEWSTSWIWELIYVMHSDEALLAIVFILFWHFYNEHLRPDVFPMSWIWITGRMSLEELRERHPVEFERLFPGYSADGDQEPKAEGDDVPDVGPDTTVTEPA